LAFDPVLAGTVTDTVALPVVHDTVFGKPDIAGDEEKTQLVVAVTEAESWTVPPAWGSVVGVAVKEVIFGGTTVGVPRGAAEEADIFGA
jgi:hypothetical protein